MQRASHYLAFDLGASSGRAILGSFDGRRMAMQELHRFRTPILESDGRLYWDLDALWKDLDTGYRKALEVAPDLKSLSVDSWGVDYVPLGSEGSPVRNAFCYRDPRVEGFMDRTFEVVPAAGIYEATGIQFMEINSVYQLMADRALEPEFFEATELRLLMGDYFLYRFGGRPVAERSLASTSQLLDVRTGDWHRGLVQSLGMSSVRWPEVVPSGTIIGETTDGIRIIAGCSHDTACAVAAVPARSADGSWAYLSCGTWSLLGVEMERPLATEGARVAGFTNEAGIDGTIRFLKNLNGLWVLEECVREWRESGQTLSYPDLIEEARRAAPAAGIVNLNDHRFGLRGGMQEKLHAFCRENALPIPPDRGSLVRLVLESLAESYRRAVRELEEVTGKKISTLHIVGGGSRNELLCQLAADRCGIPVVAGPAEATALGNLLIQASVLGDLKAQTDRLSAIREVVRESSSLVSYAPGANPEMTR